MIAQVSQQIPISTKSLLLIAQFVFLGEVLFVFLLATKYLVMALSRAITIILYLIVVGCVAYGILVLLVGMPLSKEYITESAKMFNNGTVGL